MAVAFRQTAESSARFGHRTKSVAARSAVWNAEQLSEWETGEPRGMCRAFLGASHPRTGVHRVSGIGALGEASVKCLEAVSRRAAGREETRDPRARVPGGGVRAWAEWDRVPLEK